MIITTEILYKCLREFFQKNDKNNENKRVRREEFSTKNNNDKRAKLINLFPPEYLVDGKLILKNIDMYRMVFFSKDAEFDVKLSHINFENCIFQSCDFSYLWLNPADFKYASFSGGNHFEGVYFSEEGQQNPERRRREDAWILKLHEEYPEDYYQFERLVRRDNIDQQFYRFNYSFSDDVKSKYLGWKLHLSIDPDDLSKAFELAAPIFSRYGYSFKMVNLAFGNGFKQDSAQFTIYLEENNQLLTSVEKTRKMMREVESVLSCSHIRVGEIPDSDAPTIFKYFSLRNDRFDFDDLFVGSTLSVKRGIPGYLLSRFVGVNYNPLWSNNPFASLIADKNPQFNLTKHFAGFKPKDRHEASIAYIASLYAWLNEYTHVVELPTQEKIAIKKLCFSKEAKVDDHVFKSKQHATTELSTAVKLVICYLTWLNQSPYLNNHFFPLSKVYPYKNSFSAELSKMEGKVIEFQNPQDKDSGNVDVSFPEFLKQNSLEEENTVEQEGGSNKPQKLGLNNEDRIREYSPQSPHHTRPTPKP